MNTTPRVVIVGGGFAGLETDDWVRASAGKGTEAAGCGGGAEDLST